MAAAAHCVPSIFQRERRSLVPPCWASQARRRLHTRAPVRASASRQPLSRIARLPWSIPSRRQSTRDGYMAEAQAPGRRAAATTAPGPPDFMLGGDPYFAGQHTKPSAQEPEMQAPGNKPGRQPVTGPDSDRQWRHGGPRSPARPYPSPSHGPDRRRLGRCERRCDFQPRLRVSVAGSSPESLVIRWPAGAAGVVELSELQVIAGPGCALAPHRWRRHAGAYCGTVTD